MPQKCEPKANCEKSFEHKKGRIEKDCPICGRKFWVPKCRIKRTFCSNKCWYLRHSLNLTGKFGTDAKYFNGGGYVDKSGYRMVLVSSPKKVLGGFRYRSEHVLKVEKILGRRLNRDECVHHIDGDRLNNENSNLLVCNRGYHQWLHWEMSRRYAKEKFGRIL